MAKYKTIEEATRAWVREFNAIPQAFILRALPNNGIDDANLEILCTELVCDNCGGTEYKTKNQAPQCISCKKPDTMNETYGFPMWGTMWTFGENLDEDWVRDHGGLKAMQDCGFWVYDDEDLGIFFGINGAGYDFYEQHWIPLYLKRGLKWHDQ